MKLSEQLLDVLHEAGVREIFGVPGDAINPLIEALRKQNRIRFIHVARETGLSVSDPAKLEDALSHTLACEGPALLDVRIAAGELIMPPRIAIGQVWGFTKAKITEWLQNEDFEAL